MTENFAFATAAAQALSYYPAEPRWEFTRLVESSPAMMWMANADGFCTAASRTWLEFRGRTIEQERGTGWAEGIHLEDGPQALGEYWGAFRSGQPFRTQYRIRAAGGLYVSVENAGSPWFEDSGQPGGYVGTITVLSRTEHRSRSAVRQLSLLSPRERQMLELIARGYATKEAAGQLGISYKTADSHRSHLLKKLGVHETASVVRFAVRSGLIGA